MYTPRIPLFQGFHWIWLPNPRKSWTITTRGRSWWVKNPKRCSTARSRKNQCRSQPRMNDAGWQEFFHRDSFWHKNAPKVRWSEGYGLFNLPRWIQVRHPVLGVGFAPVVFENLKSILWWGILLKLKVGQWYPTEEIEISLHIVRYLWLGKVHTWQKLAWRKSCTISANDSILIDSVRTRLSILKDMFSQPLQLQLQILPSKSFHEGPSWTKPWSISANVASSRSRSWPQKSATMGWTIGSAHAHEARRCFFRLIFNVNYMDV